MTQVEKIKAEIERRKSLADKKKSNTYFLAISDAYAELLNFIDSFQEEPVSEDLEEAAKQYAKDYLFTAAPTRSLTDHFKAGANWQKQQTIDKAADFLNNKLGDVVATRASGTIIPYHVAKQEVIKDLKRELKK